MTGRHLGALALTVLLCAAPGGVGRAAAEGGSPAPIEASGFAYEQHPGAPVPLDGAFLDADEQHVSLADLTGEVPLLLLPAYFHCHNLCGVLRASLLRALREDHAVAGRDYALAVISIDPNETPADARAARGRDLESFPLPGAPAGWHYLVGSPSSVAAVTRAIGFRSQAVAGGQFMHPAGLVVLSHGRIASYLLGAGFTPRDLHAALAQARVGRIARVSAPLLLLCFHYDALTGRYSLAILKTLRLAALITVIALGTLLLLLFRRERRT